MRWARAWAQAGPKPSQSQYRNVYGIYKEYISLILSLWKLILSLWSLFIFVEPILSLWSLFYLCGAYFILVETVGSIPEIVGGNPEIVVCFQKELYASRNSCMLPETVGCYYDERALLPGV